MHLKQLLRQHLVTLLFVLVTIVGITGCATDRAVIGQAQQVHGSIEPAVMEDEVLNNYLTEVGNRIIEVAHEMSRQGYGPPAHFRDRQEWMFGPQMRFHLVNSGTINAFTTGGEHMYIYNELLQTARTEDELAAVMAHEYAHVYARHVHKGMNRQLGALATAAALGGAGYLVGGEERGQQYAGLGAGAGLLVAQFANMGFTRSDEREADEIGFAFYTRAGWDPERFADFFRQMIEKGYDKTPEYLSSHPTLSSRVEDSEQRVERLPPEAEGWRRPPVASQKRFEEIKARAAKLGKTLPDDRTIAASQELLQALPRSCIAPEADPPDAVEARERIVERADQAQQQQQQARRR
jgi:predicted Zn-dependent protease